LKVRMALAGNANVGKSVIFNELTGLHQHVGNWPGKTVEKAEGTLNFQGYEVEVVDLPGIYSLSTYSIEELISREYIAVEQPDVIVNVVDASSLERNLAFTLQLLDLEPRMVVALNQVDVAEAKGIIVYPEALSQALGVPVVPTVAVKGAGLTRLMEAAIQASKGPRAKPLRLGDEVEASAQRLSSQLRVETPYPPRWVALKLLEGDEEVEKRVYPLQPELAQQVEEERKKLEALHGHSADSIIASERYALANKIAEEATRIVAPSRTFSDRVEEVASHPVLGYVFLAVSIGLVFYGVFAVGDSITGFLDGVFKHLEQVYLDWTGGSPTAVFLWKALAEGFIGGVSVAIPYIGPFYVALSLLEDSGYLARIAYLMDSAMHLIGLHGKGFIPIVLGFGCNVPAVIGSRVLETDRERLICAFVSSMVPCAARSIVIMGLVATYVGFRYALLLYVIDFALILVLGNIAYRVAPEEPVGLIMEIPALRRPQLKTSAQRAWIRLRQFIVEAFPIMMAGNLVVHLSDYLGLLDAFQRVFTPVTVGWLGLPPQAGVVLVFGVLRKELTLILLGSLMGSMDYSAILTPVQMVVFSFVVMVYVPCISTIAALVKEFGYRAAAAISLVEIGLAVALGGLLLRLLLALGLP